MDSTHFLVESMFLSVDSTFIAIVFHGIAVNSCFLIVDSVVLTVETVLLTVETMLLEVVTVLLAVASVFWYGFRDMTTEFYIFLPRQFFIHEFIIWNLCISTGARCCVHGINTIVQILFLCLHNIWRHM